MGLERQVIAACGSAVCGDDLAMEVPVRGPAAAPVEASVVATSNRKRRAPSCPPGRPPESGSAALVRHAAAGFLMGLVGFAALLALPLQAQAQTTVWSATLTPRVTFSGTPVRLGCDNSSTGNRRCSNSNTLSDDFTDDSKTYAVTKFFTKNGGLTFKLDTGATAATQGLTLVIDGEEFVLKEADQINGAKTQWKWNSTTLGWTAGTDVAVSLVVTDAPATGQPTISGGGQVGKTLTAATDDIEDLDGLPTTPTFTYQWVRVDGLTDTDIPGATSETYTLTASDLGKQIKVKVSFTDSRGHAEGPLTSGAYPRNGTVTVVVLPGPCPAVSDWCATMTVADDGTGFGYEFDKSGSLDDNMIEYGGKEIEVFKVYVVNQPTRERFFFESFPRVPLGTVITVGDLTLTTDTDSNDGITADKWDYPPGELPPDLLWSDGQEVRVSLVLGSSPPRLSIADASAAENDGQLMFDVTLSPASPHTVKVDFETTSGGTATEGVDYWPHVYTHVIPYGETTTQMGFALIEDAVAAAGETVMVRLSNARQINKRGKKKADLDITTAEATGTINAPTTTTTNVPGLTIRIKDATGDEDNGYLDFNVRLSRKHDDYVCYDFETISGGTAEEGTDYLKFPKATYWMQIGKRVDKPFVRLIDDAVNDNGETVKVKISNARLCNDASQTVSITRAEATGTITNSDPIPQAWLARFGRTVAEHVLDGVQARLSAPRNPGMQANVAGLWNLGTTADTTADTPADTALAAPGEAPQDGLRAHSDWIEGGLAGTDPGTSAALNLTARDLITGSAFAATGETAGGGFAAVWGRGAYSSFSGQDSDVTLDGEVTTAMLGADYAAGRWIAGVSLSVSEGEGTYGLDGKEGELDSSLTGFYPYVGYDISERLSAWGVAGYGEGNIKLTQPDTTETIRTGIDLAMVAVGARGDLMPRTEAAGFDLALTSDALMVRTTSAAAAGLVATDADVSRLRLGLDGSWLVALDSGASLTPSISIGMRHDGGDAETGFGVDLGGGLAYADEQSGLGLELNARALLAHEDENFREWGVSGALIFDPDPSSDRGLSLSVGPSWGASSTGGAEALLGPETMSGLALDNATPPGGRLGAKAAWGFPALAGRYTGTPYLGLGLRQGGRDLTLGWRLGAVRREGLELALGLEGRRLESNGRSPEHGAMVRLILRW